MVDVESAESRESEALIYIDVQYLCERGAIIPTKVIKRELKNAGLDISALRSLGTRIDWKKEMITLQQYFTFVRLLGEEFGNRSKDIQKTATLKNIFSIVLLGVGNV